MPGRVGLRGQVWWIKSHATNCYRRGWALHGSCAGRGADNALHVSRKQRQTQSRRAQHYTTLAGRVQRAKGGQG